MTGGVQLARGYDSFAPFGPPPAVIPIINSIRRELRRIAHRGARTSHVYCLHVRRGDKLLGGAWPCTGVDTTARAIERTLLQSGVERGSVLYIASDETSQGFFKPLNRSFRVFVAQAAVDLPSAAGPQGAVAIDYEVCRALTHIETFNDLTTDPKEGCVVARCSERERYACKTPEKWSRPQAR